MPINPLVEKGLQAFLDTLTKNKQAPAVSKEISEMVLIPMIEIAEREISKGSKEDESILDMLHSFDYAFATYMAFTAKRMGARGSIARIGLQLQAVRLGEAAVELFEAAEKETRKK